MWPRTVKGVGFMFNNCNIELIRVVDFVTNASSQVEPATLQDHLDKGCDSCAERLTLMQGLHSTTESQESQMITVSPLFDIQEWHYAGVRSDASLARRRVYESESKICIDIQQHESEDGSHTLEGQVLIPGGMAAFPQRGDAVQVFGRLHWRRQLQIADWASQLTRFITAPIRGSNNSFRSHRL